MRLLRRVLEREHEEGGMRLSPFATGVVDGSSDELVDGALTDLGSFAGRLPLPSSGADARVCRRFSECDCLAVRLVDPFPDGFGLQEEVFAMVHHDLEC